MDTFLINNKEKDIYKYISKKENIKQYFLIFFLRFFALLFHKVKSAFSMKIFSYFVWYMK